MWAEALAACSPEALDTAVGAPGPGWGSVGMACPRTVPTAALEWSVVALLRGSRVLLKTPAEDPAVGTFLATTAQDAGLPLSCTAAREALLTPDLAVVMGSDDTVAAVSRARGGRPVLGFGHRSSVAWITDLGSAEALAQDAARFDGRGCMSPTVVYTPLDPDLLAAALASAMARAQTELPRGLLTPIEGARLRLRLARARIAGSLREGDGWAVTVDAHPPDEALPRVVSVVQRDSWQTVLSTLDPAHLSTVGSDVPGLAVPPATRLAAPGEMQRPPLVRLHDGVDWLQILAGPPG